MAVESWTALWQQDLLLPLLLDHGPERWTPADHWLERRCNWRCGCCRTLFLGDGENCEHCYIGWTLMCVSRAHLKYVRAYVVRRWPPLAIRSWSDVFQSDLVLPFLFYHGPEPWSPGEHFGCFGAKSCDCCRSHNVILATWPKNGLCCTACDMGWTLPCVSRTLKENVRDYARRYRCACGKCRWHWHADGWICPFFWEWCEPHYF